MAAPQAEDDDWTWADDDEAASSAGAAAPAPQGVAVKTGPIPFRDPPQAQPPAQPPAAGAAPPARPAAPAPARPAAAAPPQPPARQPQPPQVRPPGAAAGAAAAGPRPAAAAAPPPPPAAAAAAAAAVPAAAVPKSVRPAPPSVRPGPAPPASGSATPAPVPAAVATPAPKPAPAPTAVAAPTAAPAPAPSAPAPGASTAPMAKLVAGASAQHARPPAADAAPAAAAGAAAPSGRDPAVERSGSGSSKGGGWGWLGAGNLGGLSNKLQQVAIGAAKDLQELTSSVQQVVAEVVAADDVSDVDRLAEYQARPVQRPPPPGTAVPAAAPPPAMTASRDSASQLAPLGGAQAVLRAEGVGGAQEDEEQRRQDVLRRLQGNNTQLESGLKAIDEQVDALAAGAAKAFGSLWGGLGTVAKTSWGLTTTISSKVEAAAKEVAKELVVGLEESREAAGQLAARAERGLETVGRGAVQLLDPGLARRGSSGAGAWAQRTAADWESSFDACFELFGGTQACEELDALTSECGRICNRARAKLQAQQRDQIDAVMSRLLPLFDTASLEGEQPQQEQQPQHVSDATLDALEGLFAPVLALRNKGRHKARQLTEHAAEAVAAAAAQAAAAASPEQPDAGAAAGEAAGEAAGQPESSPDGQPAGAAAGAAAAQRAAVDAELQRLLLALRSAAVKSLAELAAGQAMLLLTLGRSVAALPRFGRPLDDGLEWPTDPTAVAALLRQQTLQMLADTRELAGAFAGAAPALLRALPPPPAEGEGDAAEGGAAGAMPSPQQRADAVVAEVQADAANALRCISDSFGKLLYVVVIVGCHAAGRLAGSAGGSAGAAHEQEAAGVAPEGAAPAAGEAEAAGEAQTEPAAASPGTAGDATAA